MNIVHICLTGGYTEGFTYQENYLTKYHAKMGHKVTLITTQYCWHKDQWGKCKESDYQNKDGVRVIRIPYKYNLSYKKNTYIGRFVGLYELLEKIAPGFIFIHNLQFNDIDKIVTYKKKHGNVKIVVDNHSDFSNSARNWVSRNLLYKLYWRRNARKIKGYSDMFYGVLPARVAFLEQIYSLPKEKCALLVMGADDEEVERAETMENKCRVRDSLSIQQDDFLIVTGGKIDEWKTQTLLLMEAISRINKPNLKLLIFGPIAPKIKKRFDDAYDPGRMRYVSWANTPQSYDYFAIADLIVFPGRHSVYWEQAAGLGIPMLCKYWEGTTHVDCGGNVRFLKEDTVEEIQGNIQRLLDNPEEYNKMYEIAQEKCKKQFSYSTIARKSIN